jgi:hypothetical protein
MCGAADWMTEIMKKVPIFMLVLITTFLVGAADLRAETTDPLPQIDELILANKFNEAVALTRKAAEDENIESEFRLGLFYWHGVGVGQNYLEALHWVTLAALCGHEKAFAARKLMLPSVDATNWPKTLDWTRQRLQKTAETGKDKNLVALSKSYSVDFGFENSIEEYYWASLSIAVGDNSLLKRRDELSKKIAVLDAAKAQDRMTAWLDKWRKAK